MGFWRRYARKSRKEKVRNVTIREIMEVGKNILEAIEEKRLRWFGHVKRMSGNKLPLKILEWEPEGTRRRVRPKERWIDGVRRSMTNHGLTEEDTRDRDRWRNLVLGEGKPHQSVQTLDYDDDDDKHQHVKLHCYNNRIFKLLERSLQNKLCTKREGAFS
jgi:hypothetical protein